MGCENSQAEKCLTITFTMTLLLTHSFNLSSSAVLHLLSEFFKNILDAQLIYKGSFSPVEAILL